MKAFIIMYNRLTWPKAMCEYLQRTGCEPILVDNNSTYSPLLEWYKECPYKVHFMGENLGHFGLWKSGLIDEYKDRYYIVTDHDLDLSGVPENYVEFLMRGLRNNPDVIKSGLSLRISDLPNNNYTVKVHEWELKWWLSKQDSIGFFKSDIDTTFALYDRQRDFGELPGVSEPSHNKFFSAVRAPEPYTAKHLPWYITKEFLEGNEEERYYQEHTSTYWSQILKETL